MRSNQMKTEEKLTGVIKSQEFIGQKYDDLIQKLDDVMGLKGRVDDLEKITQTQAAENAELRIQLHELEQSSRHRQVEMTGILESKDETSDDLENAVINIAQKLRVTIHKSDIEAVHRAPTPFKPQPIIVSFVNKKVRNMVMENRYETVVKNGMGKRIFINESLSYYYRQLLKKSKERSKELNYDYCWFKNKQIYVKRSEQERRPVVIRNEKDLDKLVFAPPRPKTRRDSPT